MALSVIDRCSPWYMHVFLVFLSILCALFGISIVSNNAITPVDYQFIFYVLEYTIYS